MSALTSPSGRCARSNSCAATGQPSAAELASQRRDSAVAALCRKLPSAPLRASFDRLLKDAQATFAIHEDNINLYMLASGYMRYALLEAGARFAERGLLAEADRVFFLRRGELGLMATSLRIGDKVVQARPAKRTWPPSSRALHPEMSS
jgi:hypothetical protein